MEILENISLKPYNTFGIDVRCRAFAEVFSDEELVLLVKSLDIERKPFLLLGGGSNILFTHDYEGTVIRISTKGIEVVNETEDYTCIRVQAGENWDEFVGYCVEKGWGGIENLSLIPGNVGTGPVQNIGAYGAEIGNVIKEVEVYSRSSQEIKRIQKDACGFGYRDSIFKRSAGQDIILNVTFRLSNKPKLNLDYKDIAEELSIMGVTSPDIRAVREAVCNIRRRKLPDPLEIGNCGSFFKNPVVDGKTFSILAKEFPGIPSFPQDGPVKIPAAWLIEQCGWKGFRSGEAGVHPNQPLVLVNYGNATGEEILGLADRIRTDVKIRFGIMLETEVNIL